MSLTLGEKLRQAREERGISISEVAEQTRISSLYLESIEKDDYKPLPGGIFNKGFVKSYAKFIGIDEHEALQDYSKIVMQTEGEGELRKYKPEVLTDDRSNGSMIPTIIFAGIILALMTGGILFVVNYIQNQPATPSNTVNTANTSVNVNQAGSNTPAETVPQFDTLRIEFTATQEAIALTTNVDGLAVSDNVAPGTPKVINANKSIRLSYYRGFADMVELSLNGKAIKPPPAPARGNSITFEITKENAAEIWKRGQIAEETATDTSSSAAPTPDVAATVTATTTAAAATPVVTPTSVRATPTPAPKPTAPKPTPAKPTPGASPAATP